MGEQGKGVAVTAECRGTDAEKGRSFGLEQGDERGRKSGTDGRAAALGWLPSAAAKKKKERKRQRERERARRSSARHAHGVRHGEEKGGAADCEEEQR